MDYTSLLSWQKWRSALPSMDEENFYRKYLREIESPGFFVDQNKLRRDIFNSYPLEFKKLYDESASVRASVDATVERFVTAAKNSPALYAFVYDTDEAAWALMDPDRRIVNPKRRWRLGSEFFVPWVANLVPRSVALEVVYGYGVDAAGNYRKIEPTDPYFYFVFKNELFAAIMERGMTAVSWLETKKPEKMVFLGAGMAPEFRHLGLTLAPSQRALLVDNDPTINPDWLFQDLPFKSQLRYLKNEFSAAFFEPEMRGAEEVVAMGFISYIWRNDDEAFAYLLGAVKKMMRPGGIFIFELYPEHWEWQRNKAISGFYLPLRLFKNFRSATDNVYRVMRSLSISSNNLEFVPSYDDFGNELMMTYKITMPG